MVERLRRRASRGLAPDATAAERGVALVEMAIVMGLLLLIISATIDYGFAWRRSSEVATTLRSATRVAASLGTDRAADQQALLALNAGVAEIGAANVQRVIVYRSTTGDGTVPPSCLAITPGTAGGNGAGVNGVCNVYSRAQLAAMTASRFSGRTTACQSDDWDRFLCPVDTAHREDRQGYGASYIGVWMEVRYEYTIGALPGDGLTMRDHAVMRLEPSL